MPVEQRSFPIGQRVSLPGHFDGPVVLEHVRALGPDGALGYECRVRLPDGRLDFTELLSQFSAFWKQNGEILVKGEAYHEVAPQLVFMAYLQRVVNGGGYVAREYGIPAVVSAGSLAERCRQ